MVCYGLEGVIKINFYLLIFRMQDLKASLLDESTQMSAPGGPETEGMVMDETSQQASQSSVTKTNKSTYEMSNLDLIKAVTAETMFEYQWPPLMKHAEYYFLQEQVSEYLDIKAIKRKYPDLARRKVKTDERDFLLEMRVVNETQVRFHNIITVQSQFSDTFGLSEKCH